MKNFTQVEHLHPNGYALELLINGNISICVEYINFLYHLDLIKSAFIELELIKENCPEKFNYIISKIIKYKK
jgi:hypothetical protein